MIYWSFLTQISKVTLQQTPCMTPASKSLYSMNGSSSSASDFRRALVLGAFIIYIKDKVFCVEELARSGTIDDEIFVVFFTAVLIISKRRNNHSFGRRTYLSLGSPCVHECSVTYEDPAGEPGFQTTLKHHSWTSHCCVYHSKYRLKLNYTGSIPRGTWKSDAIILPWSSPGIRGKSNLKGIFVGFEVDLEGDVVQSAFHCTTKVPFHSGSTFPISRCP